MMDSIETLKARKTNWPAVALAVGLVLSLFLNLGLFLAYLSSASSGLSATASLQEKLVDGKAKKDDKIVVIPIHGLIMESMGAGPGSVSSLIAALKQAEKDDHIKAIILDIDSPGGGVTASDKMYHELVRFKQKKKVPVVSLFHDVAASGGYYVAMASDHIIAHETTITGSIGVIAKFPNFAEGMDKIGVKMNTIKSLNSQGKQSFKDMGSPYRPMRDQEKELFQNLITEMWTRFTEVVSTGRSKHLTLTQVQELADGRIFTGPQALQRKLIDSVGYRQDAYAKARELAQAPEAKIVRYQKQPSLRDLIKLEAEPTGLSWLQQFTSEAPRFLYLWTGG